MIEFETERLRLVHLTLDDAPFILALLNDPDWLRHIGDRGVRTLEDARGYLEHGPVAMVAREGFGLWKVERRADGAAMGMCGLIRRRTLDDVDLGFALLPAFRGQGYTYEAAAATLRHGRARFGLGRIVAIVSPGNAASIRLLEKLGMTFERRMAFERAEDLVLLYVSEPDRPA